MTPFDPAAMAAVPAVPAAAAARPSTRLLLMLASGVLGIALAGYAWKGAGVNVLLGGAPAAEPSDDESTGTVQGATRAQVEGLIASLEQRLHESPSDPKGWTLLGRSYVMLARYPEAAKAYQTALTLRPNDADLLTNYADVLAVQNDRNLAGEPIALIRRALQIHPTHMKALTLAGAYAFEQKNYAEAAQTWDRLVQLSEAPPSLIDQVQPVLRQARSLAGLAEPTAASAQANKAAPTNPATAASTSVSGTVTLAPGVAQRVSPQDTVFIFARAEQGGRMPLAILRKQVKDLPITFSLDDSMAMSPAATLSGAGMVVVGARISKSGNAMPQPGDWQGLSAAIAVGTRNLNLVISEPVQ